MNTRGIPALPCWTRACVAALLLCLLPATGARGQEVRWRTDYAQARQEALETGRPIFIDLSTDNCYWCKQLQLRTFKDPAILNLLNNKCIPLEIDADRHPGLVKSLRVTNFPTLVFASPTGKIFGYQEGFVEAKALEEHLNRVIAAVTPPEWMVRDFEEASRAVARSDYPRAISLLRNVVEDGKDRPIQARARQLLQRLEKQASERTEQARTLADKGKTAEAVEALNEVARVYAGTEAAREGKVLLGTLTSKAGQPEDDKVARARALLRQAQQDYKDGQYLCCLDRCELVVSKYADLPEGGEATDLIREIMENPEWTRKACEQTSERLSLLYLSLAETWLRKGQPQQAVFYLERVVKSFPGSKQAVTARVLLARLQGAPRPSPDGMK
jgi:tetratricopeptide (TPR) repeat protein